MRKAEMEKGEFIKQAGELLKETRSGADIDSIYLDNNEMAVIAYKDRHRMQKRINVGRNCNIEILKDLIKAIE